MKGSRRWTYRSFYLDPVALNMLAGAYADPVDGAALAFKGDSDSAAVAFAQSDPYVKAGLVKRWRVRKWNVVVGET